LEKKSGRKAVVDFLNDTGSMIERLGLEVQDVLAGQDRAVIIGSLSSRVKQTGKVINTDFGIILTVTGGEISRFQMLEDSFAVSRAARPPSLHGRLNQNWQWSPAGPAESVPASQGASRARVPV
jgi:uncharacterized protein